MPRPGGVAEVIERRMLLEDVFVTVGERLVMRSQLPASASLSARFLSDPCGVDMLRALDVVGPGARFSAPAFASVASRIANASCACAPAQSCSVVGRFGSAGPDVPFACHHRTLRIPSDRTHSMFHASEQLTTL